MDLRFIHCNITWRCAFYSQKVYILKIKSSDIAVLHTVAVRESTSLICAFNEKAQAEKDQSVLKVSL